MRYIYKVGVELEGGWNRPKVLKHDGSIENLEAFHIGEIASKPRSPTEIKRWVMRNYPDRVNHTCGLHVHVSFRSAHLYALCAVPDFPKFLVEELKNWGERRSIKNECFWNRLAGGNRYCNHFPLHEGSITTAIDVQIIDGGDRYTVVNYCYSKHGTIEVRVLPMFRSARTAVLAIEEVLRIFVRFIDTNKKQKFSTRTNTITLEGHETSSVVLTV